MRISIQQLLIIIILNTLIIFHVSADNRESQLNSLFKELKTKNISLSFEIEQKIWKIWSTHPNDKKLTDMLAKGSELIKVQKLDKAVNIFTTAINLDPNWAEAWNKRATVLYLMKKYEASLADIEITLVLEPRHFGALSGQALNYIELNLYEKAIESYRAAQKIYPIIDGAKKMIPQLEELIKDQAV